MNTSTLAVTILILIAIIGGGAYWYFGSDTTETPTPEQALEQQTGEQVEGQDITAGTGREATPGSQVTLDYIGQLQDGTVFDSSEQHGQPLVFVLGAQGIIPGFQIGVNGMKEGGERAIFIPPSLAYGDQQVGAIPPNSPLIFRLKLIKVEDAPATSETTGTTE